MSAQSVEGVLSRPDLALREPAAWGHEPQVARLRERQELASRLHDTVGQTLFAIGVTAHYAQAGRDPDALLAALREVEATAAEARAGLREALEALGDASPELGFELRLDGEVRLFEDRTGCTVRVIRRGDPRALPGPAEQLLLDAALEGLRNAVKHAASRLAVVHVAYTPRSVAVTVQTEVVAAPSARDGWAPAGVGAGLRLLARRAEQLCGRLELVSDPNGLKMLRLTLPTAAALR